jgi:hypothetical protein
MQQRYGIVLVAQIILCTILAIVSVYLYVQKENAAQQCTQNITRIRRENEIRFNTVKIDTNKVRDILDSEIRTISSQLEESNRKLIETKKNQEQLNSDLAQQNVQVQKLLIELNNMKDLRRKCSEELDVSKSKYKELTTLTIPPQQVRPKNVFHSSDGVDKFIFDTYFTGYGYTKGEFVEIGFSNGSNDSNSLYFEDTLGWNGLIIEKQHDIYRELVATRPKSHKLNVGICHSEKEIMVQHFTIICLPLTTLLQLHGIYQVDYLAINENAKTVLESFDFSVPVMVISINTTITESNDIKRIMHDNGFGRDTRFEKTEKQVWFNKNNKVVVLERKKNK